MRARFSVWWQRISESYWFVPSLMAFAAVVMSFVTTTIDGFLGSKWLEDMDFLYANKPAGARAVLSTVAGSMITVAGVTFSMTIVAISYSAGQVGRRLLGNFMRDRGNQITLGVFISTFLYCLLVLRTVRNADTPPPDAPDGVQLSEAFVPHVAILFALILAVASVGVLIYFIHHIPESIHISNIIARVGRQLNRHIGERFPTKLGEPADEAQEREAEADLPESFYENAVPVLARGDGYVQYIDESGLLEISTQNDLVLRLLFRAGDFVSEGKTLLLASPRESVSDSVLDQLHNTYAWGSQQTPAQNISFLISQLTEVAMRALSPGVNDPLTTMTCLDWLQSALSRLSVRRLPDAHRYDQAGRLRVVAEADSFERFCSEVFDVLRPYVAPDRNAAIHMMETLGKIGIDVKRYQERTVLERHAMALYEQSSEALKFERDRAVLTDRYNAVLQIMRDPSFRARIALERHWIGGRA